MTRQDDFKLSTKRELDKRSGHVCSCPECRAPTSGPQLDGEKSLNAGVAAHITAAQPGGPRYDASLTPEQRRHANNGIWLCAHHAAVIDKDVSRYSVELLKNWKCEAEHRAYKRLGKPQGCASGKIAIASPSFRLGAETAVRVDGLPIAYASIIDVDEKCARPTWFVNGFVVQFSLQKRQERAYAVVEHFVVTVHESKDVPQYQPLMMVFPAEVNLYYVEIDRNPGSLSREFRPSRYYLHKEDGGSEQQYPSPLVLNDNLPAQIAIRLNAKTSGFYLVSIDAVISSGEDRETLSVMTPQWIIFELPKEVTDF